MNEEESLYRDLDFWMQRLEAVKSKQRQVEQQLEAELRFVNKTIDTINERLEEIYWERNK
jgi:hypothetical protein